MRLWDNMTELFDWAIHVADQGWGGDTHPGQELDAAGDNAAHDKAMQMTDLRRDYSEMDVPEAPVEHGWIYVNGHVIIDPERKPDEMVEDHGYRDTTKPLAYGRVLVQHRWTANFQILHSNIGLGIVMSALKKAAKEHKWQFNTIVDHTGDEFALQKSAADPGAGNQTVDKAWTVSDKFPNDIQYGALGEEPTYDWQPELYEWNGVLYHSYDDLRRAMRSDKEPDTKPTEPYDIQPIDGDKAMPADLNNTTTPDWIALMSKTAAPKVKLPGPIPFIYDIEGDRVYVGFPGETVDDVPAGDYNPLGIVEGEYKPNGEVEIRTQTNMPYTIRHMIQLWYAMHPELEVGSVVIEYEDGSRQKLASVPFDEADSLEAVTAAAPDDVGERVRDLLQEDPSAVEVYNALSPLGNVYVVGGAIRDLALGRIPKDIDIMAQGISPEDCIKALKLRPGYVEVTGNQFPVIRYFHPSGYQCEVALPRRERSTGGGGRKDFDVQMDIHMPVEEDLERRDFTGNSMAVDLKTGQLIDPYGGWKDLEEGKLSLVHPNAFQDDATRILRALSSRSRHGLAPDADTEAAMHKWASRIDTHVPAEQKAAELEKLLKGDNPADAIELAQRTGVLKHLIPELDNTVGFDQKNKYHDQLLFDHIMSVLRKVSEINDDPDVRMAAMLHDIGKPESQWIGPDGYAHYYEKHDADLETGEPRVRGKDHQHHGADLARTRMRELAYANSDRQKRVEHLVRHHMFSPFTDERGARKFLNRVQGPEHARDLLDIREGDAGAKKEEWDGDTDLMRGLVGAVQDQGQATDLKGLALNGRDVMQILGIPGGPEVGQHLQRLQDIVLEDPSMNTRETLTEALLMKTANVLDPVQDTLDPDVFENADKTKPKVKPHITEWVQRQIEGLLKGNGYSELVSKMHLVFTGSLTSYQWSPKSDFDVSLWLDYETFPNIIRADMISLMVENLDNVLVPGTTHVLQCYVVPVEVQADLLYQPGLRSAYDLDRNKWIVPPEKDRVYDPYSQVPALMGWVHDQAEKLKLLQAYDPYGAKEFLHQIHQRRMRDQKQGKGDFSESNILWKFIEHEDLTGYE